MGSFLLAILILLLAILLLLPVTVTIETYFDSSCNKLGCIIYLYGFMKLLGGYLAPCPKGVAFHVSDKKALIFSYKQMQEGRKRFSPKSGIKLNNVSIYVQTGAEYLLQAIYAEQIIKWIVLFAKQRNIISRITLHRSDSLHIYAKFSVQTRATRQIIELIKYLFRRIREKWQKKKLAT